MPRITHVDFRLGKATKSRAVAGINLVIPVCSGCGGGGAVAPCSSARGAGAGTVAVTARVSDANRREYGADERPVSRAAAPVHQPPPSTIASVIDPVTTRVRTSALLRITSAEPGGPTS